MQKSKKISINFINGFNAFTGETGAGKSIIIEGLKLALGGKNNTSLNLKGNEISSIKAIFEINTLIKKNLEEQNLNTVMLLNPKNEEAIYNLAKLKLSNSDFEKSIELNKKLKLICNNFCRESDRLKTEIENLSKK